MQNLVSKYIKKTDNILVIGCGNSDLSSKLYDSGCQNITNLDFSSLVIAEMQSKNESRSNMKWIVGDMTNMADISNESFDVVLDKGALDALFSEDTSDRRHMVNEMYREISRVLKASGKYVCISLAEEYILNSILDFFCVRHESFAWCTTIETFSNVKPSPFVPFFFVFHKISNLTSPLAQAIRCAVDPFGSSTAPKTMKLEDIFAYLRQVQSYRQKRFDVSQFRPGRFDTLEFWDSTLSQFCTPRFTVFVLDINYDNYQSDVLPKSLPQTKYSCVVFLIPQKREHEYQFASHYGLDCIGRQASTLRLIAVRCNRPHNFPAMTELQSELSPLVVSLTPSITPVDEKIPYMAIQNDDRWEVIYQGHSAVSGDFIIEEAADTHRNNAIIRYCTIIE